MFPEYVRVAQVDTDWELSVTRSMLVATPLAYEELDEPATDSGNNPLPPSLKAARLAEGYDAKTVADLRGEIAKRNEDREGDAAIPVSGNKPDLIAALVADDQINNPGHEADIHKES
jgi:hypothetical protein